MVNLQIARAYLTAADPKALTRTWQVIMDEMARHKTGPNRERWMHGMTEKPFDRIRNMTLVETRAEHLLDVIAFGTVSTNIFLHRLHNAALDLGWFLAPLIPRRQWPPIHHDEKRAITQKERESNSELNAFYSLLWHLGGSQTDVATLTAEHIDWKARTIFLRPIKDRQPGAHPFW